MSFQSAHKKTIINPTFRVVGQEKDHEQAQQQDVVFGNFVKLDDLQDGQRDDKLGDAKCNEAGEVQRLPEWDLVRFLQLVPERVLQRDFVVLAVLAQLHHQVLVKRVECLLLQTAVDNHMHNFAVLFGLQLQLEKLLKRVQIVLAGHDCAKDLLPQLRIHPLLARQLQQSRPAISQLLLVPKYNPL
jgi:hypothetical protein